MTKSHSSPPKMGNNGGTAFVRINGKRIYLGKFGSAEAAQNYARCVAEWAISNTDPTTAGQPIGSITIDTLAIAFLDHVQKNDTSHYCSCRTAVKILLQLYSGTTIEAFSPKCLAAVQHQFTQHIGERGKPFSRQYCNELVKRTRRMFRWGVAQELVPSAVADALKYVPPLRQGRTTAPESKPREDVPDDVVDATLPHLLPTVAAMVQVQRLATMRPNEVCRMCVGNIDMSRKDGIWLYNLPKHKCTWRGHRKIVPLGELEQALILPYLEGKSPEQAVFSPKTAMLEKEARDAERQKAKADTKQVVPSQCRRTKSRRKDREHYDSASYARSIRESIITANSHLPEDQQIPHWFPYQLRHAGVTELILENDGARDIARAVAGQKSISITQDYNHADLKIAIEQAKKRAKKRGQRPGDSPEGQPES